MSLDLDAIRQRHLRKEQMEHRTFYEGHIVIDLAALIEEVARLRAESATFRRLLAEVVQTSADLCPACGWRFLVPGDGCLNCNRREEEP